MVLLAEEARHFLLGPVAVAVVLLLLALLGVQEQQIKAAAAAVAAHKVAMAALGVLGLYVFGGLNKE